MTTKEKVALVVLMFPDDMLVGKARDGVLALMAEAEQRGFQAGQRSMQRRACKRLQSRRPNPDQQMMPRTPYVEAWDKSMELAQDDVRNLPILDTPPQNQEGEQTDGD